MYEFLITVMRAAPRPPHFPWFHNDI